MLSHTLHQGVLVNTVHGEPAIDERADLTGRMTDLIRAHAPAPVVIVLDRPAVGHPLVSAVQRAHSLCRGLGVLLSVVSHSAPARRLIEATSGGYGHRVVVHARLDAAVDAAFAATA